MENHIKNLLEKNNIQLITNIDEINNLYNIEKLKQNNIIEIYKQENINYSIILFDTEIFNSTYLIDEFDKFNNIEISDKFNESLLNKLKIVKEKTKVYYCDNLEIYKNIFDKFHKKDIDKIKPIILFISHKNADIFIECENFLPLNFKNFLNIYECTII